LAKFQNSKSREKKRREMLGLQKENGKKQDTTEMPGGKGNELVRVVCPT